MRRDLKKVSKKTWVWAELGKEQGGGKVGDEVRREHSVIGRKMVRRCKQDGLGRSGFAIIGRWKRGSMRHDTLEDAG